MEIPHQQQRQPSMKSRFRRVCVFCGSSPGKNPNYQHAAVQLGKQLVYILLLSTCSLYRN
jgi:predicted Rossmann-fold nucleotide-binding protein